MKTNIDELASIPYEVIQDKALNTQDYLFKLIIIGDTGKYHKVLTLGRRWQKLSAFKSHGRRLQARTSSYHRC